MYSTVTGSSTVSLWLWHSTRALFITIRASAVRPEKGFIDVKEWCKYKKVKYVRHYVLFHDECIQLMKTFFVVWGGTCKGHADVLVQGAYLTDGPLLLQLGHRLLLNSEDHDVFTSDSHLQRKKASNEFHNFGITEHFPPRDFLWSI